MDVGVCVFPESFFVKQEIEYGCENLDRIFTGLHTSTLSLSHSFILFTQPLRSGRIWHKVNFKRSLTGLNSEFSFS